MCHRAAANSVRKHGSASPSGTRKLRAIESGMFNVILIAPFLRYHGLIQSIQLAPEGFQ